MRIMKTHTYGAVLGQLVLIAALVGLVVALAEARRARREAARMHQALMTADKLQRMSVSGGHDGA